MDASSKKVDRIHGHSVAVKKIDKNKVLFLVFVVDLELVLYFKLVCFVFVVFVMCKICRQLVGGLMNLFVLKSIFFVDINDQLDDKIFIPYTLILQ